jgi:alpha-L-fucosidase
MSTLVGRPLPEWFDDAKLGIFIHWGLYSVPAFAPVRSTPLELDREMAMPGFFASIPYAEWYRNSLAIDGSETRRHHTATYGDGFGYERFAPLFADASAGWRASSWADVFAAAGARYAVFVTKHADGYTMWPSVHPHPDEPAWTARRDYVTEFANAVRDRGLRLGLYYCAGMDWSFTGEGMRDLADVMSGIPRTPEYIARTDAHYRELIAAHRPDLLWNDIAYPTSTESILEHYYSVVPDGVVNDRFDPFGVLTRTAHADYISVEYTSDPPISGKKWEATRSFGNSFAYNRAETEAQMISVDELIWSLVDIVSRGGNLLLAVGPDADGTIPRAQAERLEALGAWLDVHGEAIYGTRPWPDAPAQPDVRYTSTSDRLYAVVAGVAGATTMLDGLRLDDGAATVAGGEGPVRWRQHDTGVEVGAGRAGPFTVAIGPRSAAHRLSG